MKILHISVKKAVIILVILAVAGAFVLYSIAKGGAATANYATATVERGNLVQTVSETGTVTAEDEVSLNFGNAGKIANVPVSVGDKVTSGQVLAELDKSGLDIQKNEAEANLTVARTELDKLNAGASSEDIAVRQASVSQAEAAYQAAQREYQRTTTVEAENISQAEKDLADLTSDSADTITTYEQAVATAKTSLENTKKSYQRSVDNGITSGLNTAEAKLAVVDTALDEVNTVLTDEDAKLILSSQHPQYKDLADGSRINAVSLKTAAYAVLATAKAAPTSDNAVSLLTDTLSALNKTLDALNYCYDALENTFTTSNFTQTDLDAYKAAVSADITNVTAGITSTQTAKQSLSDALLNYDTSVNTGENSLADAQARLDNAILTAKNKLALAKVTADQRITGAESQVNTSKQAWDVAKAQLDQVKAPARQQDITLAQAKVKSAQAAIDSISNQLDNSVIKAPMDGTITKVNYKVGEQTGGSLPVIAMLAENNFGIDVDISEADIAKVSLDNPVKITLDAYGDGTEFSGKVNFIEPAETVIQDVIYYKVKINFDPSGHDIKSGMTANVTITTAQKADSLSIPSRAILINDNGSKYTRLLVNNQVQEIPVTTGLQGDDGQTEIVSGLNEGQVIVTSINTK